MAAHVRSLLEDALGEQAPDVHKVLIGLFEQIDSFRKLPKSQRQDFRFRIDGKLAFTARKQYRDAVTLNEMMLDDAVARFYGAEQEVFRKFFITKGRCDVTGQVVMRRGEIGVDIPAEEDRAILESPDNTRGRAYAPWCGSCCTTHSTILSYTAHYPQQIPPHMVALFSDVEDTMLQLTPVEHEEPRIKAIMGEDAQTVLALLDARKSRLQSRRDELAHEILETAQYHDWPLLFATTRVKGNARLAEKVYARSLEYFLRGGTQFNDKDQIRDVYGMRVVGVDMAAAISLVDLGLTRAISPSDDSSLLPNVANAISEPYLYVSKNGAHRSYRTEISMGIGLSLQGLSYADHLRDQIHHPTYEEQRRDELEKLERRALDRGLPVSRLRESILQVLNHS